MTILVERKNDCAIMTFNRPDQMNALNGTMVDEIMAAIGDVSNDDDCRALVVTGAGGNFMAGADIKDYARQSAEAFRAFQVNAGRIYGALEALPKPTIAAITGYALGGGCEIALACDMIVAHPEANLGLPEVKLGLIPGGGGTQRLARKIGANRAAELLMTGRFASAAEMELWGLVNRIDQEPLNAALAIAASITRFPAGAVADVKRLNQMAWNDGLASGIEGEGEAVQALFLTGDGMERIKAFVARSENKKNPRG